MATKKELQQKISALKQQIKDARGTPCEVFSRVVGYMRPVQNWNKGKKEEFAMRKMFNVERCCGK